MTNNNRINSIRHELRSIQQQLKRANPGQRQSLLRRSRDLNLALSKEARR